LASNGSRRPEGQVGGGSGPVVNGGLVDLTGLTLRDLRDLRDSRDESCLARALSRVMSAEADGIYGFNNKI